MTQLITAMQQRQSVRHYNPQPLSTNTVTMIHDLVTIANQESGLNFQFVVNDPAMFSGFFTHYGRFKNVINYLAIIAPNDVSFDETCGYYGEKIVLALQAKGLSTCWVGGNYKKNHLTNIQLSTNESLRLVIAVGYTDKQTAHRKRKPLTAFCDTLDNKPQWFINGLDAVSYAPSAMNRQKYTFTLENEHVIVHYPSAAYGAIDAGIAKYHFELGSGYHF